MTDDIHLAPCNDEIFINGSRCCMLNGSTSDIESFVKEIAKRSEQQVDWHYSGNRANVLYIGNHDRVSKAINELLPVISTYRVSIGW